MKRNLIIGTRGSQMALTQTEIVRQALLKRNPDLTIETKVITTKGDRNMSPIPLDGVGKNWFTKEIEVALLSGDIDLAVHSLKDLAPEQPDGLTIWPVLKRDDARDALVPCEPGTKLADMPQGAIIGTDSLRRKANLLHLRPDLVIRSIRGNVQTRLTKLRSEGYDAVVLAAAGLERVGEQNSISEYFEPSEFVPAVGQGVLAVEVRTDDRELSAIITALQDAITVKAVAAEQVFSEAIGGGCKLPVGCYVEFDDVGHVTIYGLLGSDDATQATILSVSGSADKSQQLARDLASQLLKLGL